MPEKQGLQIVGALEVFLVSLGVIAGGIVTDRWLLADQTDTYKGLFQQCASSVNGTKVCSDLWDVHDDYEWAGVGLLGASSGFAILAFFTFTIVPLSAVIQILAGALQVGGALTYVIPNLDDWSVSWSFYLSVGGGGLLLLNGLAYAAIARIHRYPMRPVLPCFKEYHRQGK